MSGTRSKINPPALYVSTGVFLGAAVVLAAGRTCIRAYQERRLFVDDGFFLLATITLVAGSALLYLDIPLVYSQIEVSSGAAPPPADFVQQLLKSIKLQNAAVVILTTTIFSVKFSFWFFFRTLLRRLHRLTIWWWCILPFLLMGAGFCIAANFISCPIFDESIFEVCLSQKAKDRQSVVLKVNATMDIFTDVLLISIPVLLLRRVQISLRRKFALGSILCLSIFMIIVVIIKVSTGTLSDGQVDSPWVLFWFHIEAAVAVIVLSITAFRALFVSSQGNAHSWNRLARGGGEGSTQKGPLYTPFGGSPPTTVTSTASSNNNRVVGKDHHPLQLKHLDPFLEGSDGDGRILVTHNLSQRGNGIGEAV